MLQTITEPPLGNCLQAAVASILELALAQTPNFVERQGPEWYDSFERFLLTHGLYPIYVAADIARLDGRRAYGYHLIQGLSPRGDYDHVVVGHNGRPVHDPFPGGGGLRKERFHILFGSVR